MSDISERAIVVTGASTGIGRAAVASAVKNGARVFASVRKQADADELVKAFGAGVTPLLFDVADEAGVRAGAAQVAAAIGKRNLFGLVNNAGIAVGGPLMLLDTEELRKQLDINVLGVHRVTQAFAPLMGFEPGREGPPGRIVMISSVGGRIANPFFGPYNASKFALEGYSAALRRELIGFGVDVIVVGPAAIATPIWEKSADEKELARFSNSVYAEPLARIQKIVTQLGRDGLPAEDVGDLIWRCLTIAKPKTRYAIARNLFMSDTLPRMMPPRVWDRLLAKRLGLTRA